VGYLGYLGYFHFSRVTIQSEDLKIVFSLFLLLGFSLFREEFLFLLKNCVTLGK
jgi:hypothetical protein